jgi:hypothetical protein
MIVVLAALVAGAVVATGAVAASKTITTKMNGAQESPKGDPNGSGTAKVTLNSSTGKVCFNLTWSKIGKPTAAHIHKGAKGKAGDVVIPFFAGSAKHKGCVSAKKSLVAAIVKKPGAYYVNIHDAKYPAGALRGQL